MHTYKNGNPPRLPVTAGIVVAALILGIPAAAAAIMFTKVDMPNIILGEKEIKAGLNGATKTVSWSLLSGPQDAIIAGAFISIICSLLFSIGAVVVRHVSQHNIFGWAMVFPALASFAANVGIMAYVFVESGKHKETDNRDDIKYVDGKYETNGKVFTREAWACMMDKWFKEREGEWAEKACNDMKTGRTMTIPMAITSALLFALALWQVQRRGGFGWLMGRRKNIAAMNRAKGEYVDLPSR